MVFLEKEQVDVALSNTLDELHFLQGETSAAGLVLSHAECRLASRLR